MHSLVIRDALIVDGTGRDAFYGDISIDEGVISSVGNGLGRGRREINAEGLMLTPGWVDIHTHYDGQAIWDQYLTPSSWHGVTTAVFGNCGVGFAPVRKGSEKYLINLMEGVEDIPESVLSEGLDFSWESFPQYMDALARVPRIMDVGAQIPHAALRFFVMGEKGADYNSNPTQQEILEMGNLVECALESGALGFSTSRTIKHKAGDGSFTPSLEAKESELLGIADGIRRAGGGIIEVNSDFQSGDFEIMRKVADRAKSPLTVLLLQVHNAPNRWRETLNEIHRARQDGQIVTGQVGSRPIGIMMNLEGSVHPFINHPEWKKLKTLTPSDRVSMLIRNKSLRDKLIREIPLDSHSKWIRSLLDRTFKLGEPINFEPRVEESVTSVARKNNAEPLEVALEWLLDNNGKSMLFHTFENYYEGDLNVIYSLLKDNATVCGLGDAGAHVGFLCDAGSMTSMLDFWVKRRERGPKLPIEFLVKKQTLDTAITYNLLDRGRISEGYRADINLIDFDSLRVLPPTIEYDLPAGGKRVQQKAEGYRYTFVAGAEVMRDGEPTGNLPGKLIRARN